MELLVYVSRKGGLVKDRYEANILIFFHKYKAH